MADAPFILVDCGHSRKLHSGLGQVALQYMRALSATNSDFSFRFLTHPRFTDFHHIARGLGASCVSPRFSPTGWLARIFDKESMRYVYRRQGHVLRHALHRNLYPIPAEEKVPFVLTLHDMHFLHDTPKRRRQALARLQASVRRAHSLVFISEYARTITAQHLDFGQAQQRVIYNGVEKPDGEKKPAWFNDELLQGDGSARPFLLSISPTVPHKNCHILPPMLAKLAGMNLIIVGGRKKRHAPLLEGAVQRAGVHGRVRLPGAVDEGEKAWLLAHCAGFVFPSLREGFGMPVVEALHFGKPVFCFRNTALPEVGGDAVYYWRDESPESMADTVNEVLAQEQEAGEKKQAARREWASQFSWSRNAASYLEIYRHLISQAT